jgi:hypothetical protein
MRIAVVSDIHGNRTAFEAVPADLRPEANDAGLQSVYGALGRPIAVYGISIAHTFATLKE